MYIYKGEIVYLHLSLRIAFLPKKLIEYQLEIEILGLRKNNYHTKNAKNFLFYGIWCQMKSNTQQCSDLLVKDVEILSNIIVRF